jgi:Type I phosphodiesterase / nucleotide pyrophosphatase
MTVAAVDWPATRHAPPIAFNLPFFKDQRVFETHTAHQVWSELGALGFPLDRQGEWAQLPKRFLKDAMVADVAATVIARQRPELLLVHFLCTDSFQHLHGPRSPEAYWAIEYVDHQIARLLAALPAGALDRDTVVFVVSDHGFFPSDRGIRGNVRLRQLGLLQADAHGRITRAEARLVMNHGAAYVYLTAASDPGRVARDLALELSKIEGVAAVWRPEEYTALGLPTPAENALAGDLLLEAAPGYSFVDGRRGRRGDRTTAVPRHPRAAADVARQRRVLPGRWGRRPPARARRDHQSGRRPDDRRAPRAGHGAGRGPAADRGLRVAGQEFSRSHLILADRRRE